MFGHQRVQILENSSVGWGPDLRLAPAATSLPQNYNSSMAIYGGAGGGGRAKHRELRPDVVPQPDGEESDIPAALGDELL